mgnify:CR=1 FL=1
MCPPIPGRVDYIHYVADLLSSVGIVASDSRPVRMLDIGTGANGIYSLLAAQVHGWQCTGTEIDPVALKNLAAVLDKNEALKHLIDLRLQRDKRKIFDGVIKPGERFDLSVCNPPFHASLEEASKGTERKLRNLGKGQAVAGAPVLNFGGQKAELWCEGGEAAFLAGMIEQSEVFAGQCLWFSSLVSKKENLPAARKALARVGAQDVRVIDMAQGNKVSRILAWSFLDEASRTAWWSAPGR